MQLSSDESVKTTQLQTLKSYVNTNYNGIFDQATANALNEFPASGTYVVWKHLSTLIETGEAIDLGELGGLTTANASRIQAAYDVRPGGFKPYMQSDRALFGDVFSAAGGVNTRAALLNEWQREATIGEQVLGSGIGTLATGLATDGTVTGGSPATLGDGAYGDVTLQNLIDADGV